MVDAKYLALSHVWGCNPLILNIEWDKSPIYLPLELPQTTKDAIQIAICLGFRYIWIDRYCINQKDKTYTMDQIRQMGSIYFHAFATICALNESDDDRLYGVSRPRSRCFVRKTSLGYVAEGVFPTYNFEQDARWWKRGWTYQELCLSRRYLLFFSDGVVFACRKECSIERLSYAMPVDIFVSEFLAELYKKIGRNVADQDLSLHVREYSRRELTHIDDSLDAFKGLLSFYEHQSYRGVLIYTPSLSANEAGSEGLNDCEVEAGFLGGLTWFQKQEVNYTIRQSEEWWHDEFYKPQEFSDEQPAAAIFREGSDADQQEASQTDGSEESFDFTLLDGNPGDFYPSLLRVDPQPPLVIPGHTFSKFPSWSWTLQNLVAHPILASRGSKSNVNMSDFHVFQPELWVETLDDRTIRFYEFHRENSDVKTIPEQSRFLQLKTVLGHWTGTKVHDRIRVDSVEALDQSGSIPRWTAAKIGLTRFDRLMGDKDRGSAILIAIGKYAVWLAVTQGDDGTYYREGLIISSLPDPLPAIDTLQMIRLG